MLLQFQKGDIVRHLGLLDLQRTMQRALRRSGLPIAYSNGFNPHIVMSFASALSSGIPGDAELLDVSLSGEATAEACMAAMNRVLPPALQVSRVRMVDDRFPKVSAALRQAELERVVELEIEALDELGEQSRFRLILEAMGRRSNLILCAVDGHIIDCLRRVDFEMSQERQVLPGLFYHLPPAQDKRSPLAAEREEFLEQLAQAPAEQALDRWLLDTYTAISPLVARELVYRACGATDARRSGNENALWESFSAWQSAVRAQNFLPVLLRRDGKPADFTYGPVFQYEGVQRLLK